MNKLQWPKWFPYPSSWVRAIVLVGFYSGFFVAFTPVNGFANDSQFAGLLFGSWLAASAMICCYHFLLTALLTVFNTRPTKGYLSRKSSFWEGIVAFANIAIAGGLTFAFCLGAFNEDPSLTYPVQALKYTPYWWIVSAAYFYQCEVLFGRFFLWIGNLFKGEIKTKKQPESLIDPIEAELNQLKAGLGVHRMKSVKKKK